MTFNPNHILSHAQASIMHGSKSFGLASQLLDRKTRENIWLLYAWCRKCDDLADGQDHGGPMAHVDDPEARLAYIRKMTRQALAGKASGELAFDALALVAARCGFTPKMAEDVIDGFALDIAGWRPRDDDDLYQYCYHVAGAVGVMMAAVLGVNPNDDELLDRACDLGMAFQLANIARDISEDDIAGRCYIPMIWLSDMDIEPGQHMKPHYRPRLAVIARKLCDTAQIYEQSARFGASKLPFRARWAIFSAAGIYGDIARKVSKAGIHAWDQRQFVGKRKKLFWIIKSAWAALWNRPEKIARDGLWSRPQ